MIDKDSEKKLVWAGRATVGGLIFFLGVFFVYLGLKVVGMIMLYLGGVFAFISICLHFDAMHKDRLERKKSGIRDKM